MKDIFNYIDRHIIWVIIVALLIWFAGWKLSSFPPTALLFLLGSLFYFSRGFKQEIKSGIEPKTTSFVHKKSIKFVLFLFLFYVLGAISKIVVLYVVWIIVWIIRGENVAYEIVHDNHNLMSYQTDYFVAVPVMIILIVFYILYLKQNKVSTGKE